MDEYPKIIDITNSRGKIIILVILGILVAGGGFAAWRLFNKNNQTSIEQSVSFNKETPIVNKELELTPSDQGGVTNAEGSFIPLSKLKERDIDGDGLSDYDELVVYETVWNKADTDEDGYTDGQEERNGYDPKDKLENIDFSKRPLPSFGDLRVEFYDHKCEHNLVPGDKVRIQGGGFERNSEVLVTMVTGDIVITGERPDVLLGIAKTNSQGSIDETIAVPEDFEIGFSSKEYGLSINFTDLGIEVLGTGSEGAGLLLVAGISAQVARSCLTKEDLASQSLKLGEINNELDSRQYKESKTGAIQKLPFIVFKAMYLPPEWQMSKYDLEDYYGQNLEEVTIGSNIEKITTNRWAHMEQVKLSLQYYPNCPADHPASQQKVISKFYHKCELVGILNSGEKVYWSKLYDYSQPEIVSVLKGETLIVLSRISSLPFSKNDLEEIMKVFNSLRVISKEELINQF